MSQDVAEFVRACDLCFRTKTSRSSRQGSLQPLPVPFRAWSDASTDYITPLPECERHEQRYKHILVVVCRLTKMRLSIPTVTLTAEDLAIVFLSKVYVLHGTPDNIIRSRITGHHMSMGLYDHVTYTFVPFRAWSPIFPSITSQHYRSTNATGRRISTS